MARNPIDPFDDPFENWDDGIDTPRKAGRPSSRRNTAKGPNGRPRIRPLEDKYSRRRGRPAKTPNSVADRIEREALAGGGYIDKGVITSVKGLEKSVGSFQSKVITPLAKSVNTFAQSVNRFNAYHQQYLKDQMALTKEMHETFKLFRKASIDPLLRNLARTRKGTSALYTTFNQVADSGYTKKEFREFVNQMGEIDDKLKKSLEAGVVATEATDTFLKEYYKTSRGTSKFLNSVAYATEDISEDIAALRDNMAKYFKGKHNNVSVLHDHTEALRQIEKNTAAPTMGKRVMSAITGAILAAGKTAFKYNRYGTTQLIASMTGMKLPNLENMGQNTLAGKIGKVITDAYDVAIRQKVRDAEGNLRYTYETAATGGYGEAAMGAAEGIGRVGRSFNGMVAAIRKAWDESKTKEWAKYFWAVGETIMYNAWDRYGAQGERSINATITNYGSKRGNPKRGERTTLDEDIYNIVQKVQQGVYQKQNDRSGKVVNLFGRDDFSGDFTYGSNALAKEPEAGGYTFAKSKPASLFKGSQKAKDRWGKGSNVVSFESKSESDINQADVSDPKRAFASLAKLQGRAVGYLKKIWSRTKAGAGDMIDKAKDSGWLGKAAAAGGLGWFARNLLKNRKFLKGKAGGLSLLGGLIFGSHAFKKGFAGSRILGKHAGASKAGSIGRVLWDTFGWGATKGKGHMGAIGAFKNTRLGQSALGTMIRRAAITASGKGTDLGSRLLGGAIHAGKWGGGPLGALAGLWHGAGVQIGKGGISLAGRQAIASLGGVAAKGGSRTKGILNAAKAAKFAKANPIIAKVLGTGALGGVGAALAAPVKGLGSMMAKIPSKDKFLGKILGGAGAKLLVKTGGKGVAKALAKQIPILGAIIGIGFGIHRFTKGDVLGGILEIVSGLLTLVPSGAGNAAALGIDAFLIGRDIHKAVKGDSKEAKKVKQKMEKDKVAKEMGLGPNPSGAQVLGAASALAEGSDVNHVSQAQKTIGEAGYGGNPYMQAVPLQQKQQKRGFWKSVGSKIKTAGQVAATYVTPTAGGDKVYQTKDTGAISWNGKRHDKLMPKFQKALFSAADEMFKKTGHKVNITSAIRTDEEQAALYYRWKKGDKNIMTPALPVNDYPQYGITGTHNNNRSGHLVGGAVDVSNWKEFKPYAEKYGLHWQGAKDPVHFQVNDRGPVITNAKAKPVVANNTPNPNQAGKTGDGDNYMNSAQPYSSTSSGTTPRPAAPNIQTEVSPMIQDYGLAIINSLIFA